MRNGINILPLIVFLCMSIVLFSHESNAQTYLPVGPQVGVPVAVVTEGGWTECYRDRYENHLDADFVLAKCPGDKLMLSCRPSGSSSLALLAQADRSDVTFDTGNNSASLHVANGTGWYFNTDSIQSWGFVRAGDSVSKNNCDTDGSGANDERLCWHLNDFGGYRCGSVVELNDSLAYERIVYTNTAALSTIPTLSEWGLIAMAGILGLAGLLAAKRRKAAV
jgi:exosortase sorting signal-containing protein